MRFAGPEGPGFDFAQRHLLGYAPGDEQPVSTTASGAVLISSQTAGYPHRYNHFMLGVAYGRDFLIAGRVGFVGAGGCAGGAGLSSLSPEELRSDRRGLVGSLLGIQFLELRG